MTNSVVMIGLVLNLIASIMIAYGRIFRSKRTVLKESRTDGYENVEEAKHRHALLKLVQRCYRLVLQRKFSDLVFRTDDR